MRDVIINLSQRGGSHMRPLMALLNRKFPEGDFTAKSGNRCLKLSTLITWLNSQVENKNDLYRWWNGTCSQNQVTLGELVPLKPGKTSLICRLVWEEDREAVQEAMEALGAFLLKKVQ